MVGSYAALDLTRRSADAHGAARRLWIAGAGVTMGVGIWSMHFIGMLSLRMGMPMSYDPGLVVLSLVAAVAGAGVSLAVVIRPQVSRRGLVSAAAFMGFAVAAMHYLGMASMQMAAVTHWRLTLVALSIVIGLVASFLALWLLVRIRESADGFGFAPRLAAAALLGVGIAGLHYTAMAACTFTMTAGHAPADPGVRTSTLVVMLLIGAGVMLAVLLGGAALDQRRAALAADLTIVANIARELCRAGDAAARICGAVQELAGADFVLLAQPGITGELAVTAAVGMPAGPPAGDHSGRYRAPEITAADAVLAELRASGTPRAGQRALATGGTILCEPMSLDGETVGVLVIGFRDARRRLGERTLTLVSMVTAEGAVAIDRQALLDRLAYMASHDELTGLVNRRVLAEELEREVSGAVRHGRPLSVAMLDLDHFKRYNDAHGHQAGDLLLKGAAEAWRTTLRGTDVMARYGGEEFLVILPDCELEGAIAAADRLREVVPSGVTCSAGVALLHDGDTVATLIGRADTALYHAKAAGRDRTSAVHLTTAALTSRSA